jgi:hypothetical protein
MCKHVMHAKNSSVAHPPRMLCLQNGQLKAKFSGANVPLLASSIYELTPANAEIDELEVRQPACNYYKL